MSSKQGLLIGCGVVGVVVLLCGGIFGGIFYTVYKATQPAVKATDEFLALVGSGQLVAAYNSGSTTLRPSKRYPHSAGRRRRWIRVWR